MVVEDVHPRPLELLLLAFALTDDEESQADVGIVCRPSVCVADRAAGLVEMEEVDTDNDDDDDNREEEKDASLSLLLTGLRRTCISSPPLPSLANRFLAELTLGFR